MYFRDLFFSDFSSSFPKFLLLRERQQKDSSTFLFCVRHVQSAHLVVVVGALSARYFAFLFCRRPRVEESALLSGGGACRISNDIT